jgi:hypothetical protein
VLIIRTAFSTMCLLTFARRGANCCACCGRVREENLEFGTLQASGRGLGQLMEIKEETIWAWDHLVVVVGWSCN